MNWHDTRPTKAGTYYLKIGDSEYTAYLNEDQRMWLGGHPLNAGDLKGCKFGNRIPTNDELAELRVLTDGLLYFAADVAAMPVDGTVAEYKAKINAILGVADETDGQ